MPKTISRIVLVLVSLLPAACASNAAEKSEPFYLHPGDTVVFYGDSITEQRLYTMLTELFAVTRYPNLNARFVHSGWGGDRVTGGGGGPIDLRLQRDVLSYKPTVMTIMLGMNDGKYANHTSADDQTFYTGYKHIVDTVQQRLPALRITAVEPSPFDDVTRPFTLQPNGYNAVLVNYGQWIQHYAGGAKLAVADLNAGVVEMLKRANASDPALAQKIIPDRIHPSLAGHLIMAEQLLKAWNARATVSAVTIEASGGKVIQSENTSITDLHPGAPFVWTQTDESLPLPFADMLALDRDKTLDLAIRNSDVTEVLNQQPLRITGLNAGKYNLTIDGERAGTFTDAELARGINLAVLETPMSRQAMEVRDLTVKHLDVHQARWRTIEVPDQDLDLDHLDQSLKALDALEAELVQRQHAAAQPRPHVYQLAPAA